MNVSSKVILTLSQLATAMLRDHLDRLYVCVFLRLLVSFNAIYPGFAVMKEQYRMLTLLTLARRLTFSVVLFTMKKNDDLGLAHRQKSTGEKHDFVLRRGLMVSKSILIEKAEGQELLVKLLLGLY